MWSNHRQRCKGNGEKLRISYFVCGGNKHWWTHLCQCSDRHRVPLMGKNNASLFWACYSSPPSSRKTTLCFVGIWSAMYSLTAKIQILLFPQLKLQYLLLPYRLAGGWWLVLICSERKIMLMTGLFWEKSIAGWWLITSLFREKSIVGWWLIKKKGVYFGFVHTCRSNQA
jgi:hypothetical protein